jgi:hypothetical protein
MCRRLALARAVADRGNRIANEPRGRLTSPSRLLCGIRGGSFALRDRDSGFPHTERPRAGGDLGHLACAPLFIYSIHKKAKAVPVAASSSAIVSVSPAGPGINLRLPTALRIQHSTRRVERPGISTYLTQAQRRDRQRIGEPVCGRMLTVVATCRQRGINVLDYLTRATRRAWTTSTPRRSPRRNDLIR